MRLRLGALDSFSNLISLMAQHWSPGGVGVHGIFGNASLPPARWVALSRLLVRHGANPHHDNILQVSLPQSI